MDKITFWIGNGFDVNVGLKTTYSDFYKYYTRRHVGDIIADNIAIEKENWSDLELGLGAFTKEVEKKWDADRFWESLQTMQSELVQYLKNEAARAEILAGQKRQVALEMRRSLVEFYHAFPDRDQRLLKKRISAMTDGVEYSFISLNYTDVLDRCCKTTRDILSDTIGEYACGNGKKCPHRLDKMGVLHLHGTLASEMILGVNDIDQIKGASFRVNELDRQSLIKLEMNRRFGNQKEDLARRLIHDSSIICTFGVSIGETDKVWWQEIGNWLLSRDDRYFIVCIRLNNEKGNMFGRQFFQREDQNRDKLRRLMELDDKSWDSIKNRILIETNPGLFQFKLVSGTKGSS